MSVAVPPFLPIFVGYGFVVAAITMTAILDGRAGAGALLRRFLVWRFGLLPFWRYLLGIVANAIIFTWVFNSTGGACSRSRCSTPRSSRRWSSCPSCPPSP